MKSAAAINTLFALALLPSLASAEQYVSSITISQDSSNVAFLINNQTNIPPAMPGREQRAISLAWCNSATPNITKRLDIDAFHLWPNATDIELLPGCLRFSPNARELAVLTPYKLTVIDLKHERQLISLDTHGRVSSFQWLSDTEIGYVKHELKEPDYVICVYPPPPVTSYCRTFWRLQLLAGGTHVLCRDQRQYHRKPFRRHKFTLPTQPEVWSPDGRYLAYVSGRHVRLLRIRDSSFRNLGHAPFDTRIYWKPDGSALFFADSEYRKATLYKVTTATITDFSTRLAYEMGELMQGLVLEGWTSDGRFLVFNSWPDTGAYLVQLQPFKVVRLCPDLAQHVNLNANSAPYIAPVPLKNTICVYDAGVQLARYDRNGKVCDLRTILRHTSQMPVFAADGNFYVTQSLMRAAVDIRRIPPNQSGSIVHK